MQIHKVLNYYCESGEHEKCPAKSKGTKSDPHTYICVCSCHSKKS